MEYDRGEPHELLAPHYAPRPTPLPIPEAAYSDEPLFCLSVNGKWVAHILGVLNALDQPDAWQGDVDQVDAARQQVNEIMLLLMYACEESVMPEYPRSATLWHDQATITAGNAITAYPMALAPFSRNDALYNFLAFQNTAANGDSFEQYVLLEAGDYAFRVLGGKDTAEGMVSWYLDDEVTPFISNQDWYASTLTINVVQSGTVTVPTSGLHTIKGVVTGKNASSFAYYIPLAKYWLEWTP